MAPRQSPRRRPDPAELPASCRMTQRSTCGLIVSRTRSAPAAASWLLSDGSMPNRSSSGGAGRREGGWRRSVGRDQRLLQHAGDHRLGHHASADECQARLVERSSRRRASSSEAERASGTKRPPSRDLCHHCSGPGQRDPPPTRHDRMTNQKASPRAQSPGDRDEPVPAAARGQPRRLVSLGRGGAGQGARRGQADPGQHRLLGLPLVPRHGARVVRERRDRGEDERALRQHQGRPRGAARSRLDLHDAPCRR